MARVKAKTETQESKFQNISVDREAFLALQAKSEELAAQFGFKPKISQTISYLVKNAK